MSLFSLLSRRFLCIVDELHSGCERCGLVHVIIKYAIQNSRKWCKTYQKLLVFTFQFLSVTQDKHKPQDNCYGIKGFPFENSQ